MLSSSVSISLAGMSLRMAAFDVAEDPLAFLNARAGRVPDVEADFAGVDGREEIRADQKRQAAGNQHHRGETEDVAKRCSRRQSQQSAVIIAEFFELGVEPSWNRQIRLF